MAFKEIIASEKSFFYLMNKYTHFKLEDFKIIVALLSLSTDQHLGNSTLSCIYGLLSVAAPWISSTHILMTIIFFTQILQT